MKGFVDVYWCLSLLINLIHSRGGSSSSSSSKKNHDKAKSNLSDEVTDF